MKTIAKLILIIIALGINAKLFAQNENIAVVAADKMNVLYVGIDNPISIAVPGIASDKLQVSINNGSITGSNGKYIVKIDKHREATIEVMAPIAGGKFKKVGSSVFRVNRLPAPLACIANNCSPEVYISKEELLRDPELRISFENPLGLKMEIVSFTASVYLKEGLKTITVSGNKFNQELMDMVKKADISKWMYLENIKIKLPEGTRILQSIAIKFAVDVKTMK
jgi:gliding motility-associated protein GldM